ncbi:uncharacterized protein TNCV_2607961 [Trichonephila clavipes]|uniref:Uncharacterized protein n=1 Tax=Trichonephila clavipes TaxID=2585209 RepID=A0A8X6VB99_TRICX|nr:uncharacterized protein TNCV_2607961 [Trichonephila clavipes]
MPGEHRFEKQHVHRAAHAQTCRKWWMDGEKASCHGTLIPEIGDRFVIAMTDGLQLRYGTSHHLQDSKGTQIIS